MKSIRTIPIFKRALKKAAAVVVLCLVAACALRAEPILPMEADTNAGTNAQMKPGMGATLIEAGKMQLEKDLATDRLNADKDMAEKRYESQQEMVHDLAWNSWVLFVIAIFFFGYLRDKRRHETIRLMVEKGTPITPELLAGLRRNRPARLNYDPRGYLRWGVTLVAVGVAMLATMIGGRAGWIVLAVGLADMVLWVIERKCSNGGESK